MKSNLLAMAVAIGLGTTSFSANAATHHYRHRVASVAVGSTAPSSNMAAELAMRDREIAALKDALANVQAKVDELDQRTDAQSDVNTGTAQAVEKLQADAPKVDALAKLVNDTTVGGRVFVDISDISQKKNGVKTAATGDGLDVKRGYLTVAHQFNDIWSASLTTDFNYISADSETQLFIKNLYLQGKFSDAFAFRAGAIPMPWIPYAESFYGYRYVENTLIDKQKMGNSADWGVSANGKLIDGMVDYSGAAINGGGYKNPSRSKSMDFEGRVGIAPIDNVTIAVGGYSGDLGKETEITKAQHNATRGDALIAYAKGNNRIGAEYYTASNWNTVLLPLRDKADGYSLWGSYGFTDVLSVFARYDRVKPSKDLDPTLRDKYFNFGLQWDVRKGVKVAAVYKNDDLSDSVNDQKTREFGIFGDISF